MLCSALFAGGVMAALPAVADGKKLPTLAPLVRQVSPAVVNISALGARPSASSPLLEDPYFRQFLDRMRPQDRPGRRSLGSGTIVDADKGYILTNQHVIEGGDTIVVILKNGRKLQAKLIGADPQTDIALLQVEADGLTAIPLGDSDELEAGDFVLAIGSPYGLAQTVTSGIVSATGRSRLGFQGYENFIQTDAATNPGNSGGPLLNLAGEMVGINTAILSPRGASVGIGFAIPVNMVRAIMQQMIEYGNVSRGIFGVRADDPDEDFLVQHHLKAFQGARVTEVLPDTPAQQAGLRVGDVITGFNGREVVSANHLHNLLGLTRVGNKVELEVFRNGFVLHLAGEIADPYAQYIDGAQVSPYLEGAKLNNYYDESEVATVQGLAVGAVEVDSSAWRVGLREADIIIEINKTPVADIEQARELLKDETPMFHIRLQRNGEMLNLISPV